jgi:glutaredoxin domain-containing cysteine-rich protein 1
MGVVRGTYAKCQAVKQILRTLMVKFEERDVFMSYTHQQDICDRMQSDVIDVPQLFVEGQYIGVSNSFCH